MDTRPGVTSRISGSAVNLLAGFVFAVALGGCSTIRSASGTAAAEVPALAPRLLAPTFTASGRVAARISGESTRGFSGGFSWVHRTGGDTIELLTPLGQIAARISMSSTGATIELSDGTRTYTTDPEAYLSESFGVGLPLAALPTWIQGVPLPGVAYRAEADSRGRPASIFQNGWQIQYSEYSSDTPAAHPTRLQLTHGNVEVRLIVAEWSTP